MGSYEALVIASAEQGELPRAEKYARTMEAEGMTPSYRSYSALIDACLEVGECRRAHRWCEDMISAGFTKPNRQMMTHLVRMLCEAGNPQVANHWLTFMNDNHQPLDKDTYEWVRNAHPAEILPSILSGESLEFHKPPATRPATVGGERRLSSSLPALQV